MKTQSKVSHREVWLISLLPAALVVIISFALPSPADQVSELEDELQRLQAGEEEMLTELREYAAQLKRDKEEMVAMEQKEQELSAQLDSATAPPDERETLDMAGVLDEFGRQLTAHGAQVVAMEEVTTGSTTKKTRGQDAENQASIRREWVVRLVATWPVLHAALKDPEAFPRGLSLSAMNMEPTQPKSPLHRWELVVNLLEQSP
ncbi:MAG: hypothetical protein AAGI37_05130 [Planctomycetota bacterium]